MMDAQAQGIFIINVIKKLCQFRTNLSGALLAAYDEHTGDGSRCSFDGWIIVIVIFLEEENPKMKG